MAATTQAARALALAAVLMPAALAGTAQAHGTEHHAAGLSDRQLLKIETRELGRAHALEHDAARRASEREHAALEALTPHQRAALAQREIRAHAAQVAGEDPALDGRWDPQPFELPTYAIHAAMLPTGKVLFYGYPYATGWQRPESGDAWLWDPTKGTGAASFEHVPPPKATQRYPNDPADPNQPDQLFCSGQSFLPTGELLVTGGNDYWPFQDETPPSKTQYAGMNRVYTFNPWAQGTQADPYWTRQPDMATGRWYPSQLELGDGRTFVIGGLDEDGAYHNDASVFTPGTGLGAQGTIAAPTSAKRWVDNYPHLFLLPTGDVGSVGASVIGPNTNIGVMRVGANGSLKWDGTADASSLDLPRIYSAGVQEPGHTDGTAKVMIIGGYGATDASGVAKSKSTVESVDFSTPKPKVTQDTSLNVARSNEDVVLLPDGSMVAVGGGNGITPQRDKYGVDGPEHQVELWDPASRTWRLGAAQTYDRAYHATALLLPDGRVWSAGDDEQHSGDEAWEIDPATGEAKPNAASDHGEIYSPPYLFQADGSPAPRPAIDSAPDALRWNVPFWLGSRNHVQRAVLVAPAAVTHKVDMNQRQIELRIVSRQDGKGAQVLTPPSPNIAPPGYYMMFLLDEHGVPSVAKWVRLGADAPVVSADPPPDPTPPGPPAEPTPVDPAPTGTEPVGAGGTPVTTPAPTPAPAGPRGQGASTTLLPPQIALRAERATTLRRTRRLTVALRTSRTGTIVLRVTLGRGRHVVRLPVVQRRVTRAGRVTITLKISAASLRRAAPSGSIHVVAAARQTPSAVVAQTAVTLK